MKTTNYCQKCGGYVDGDVPDITSVFYCICPKTTPVGWECPKCRKIHAPDVKECGCTRSFENQTFGNKQIPFNESTKLFD